MDFLVLLDVRDFQVLLATLETLVQRVLLDLVAHQEGKEILVQLVSLVSVASLVPPAQTVHRVHPVSQDPCQQPTASSSPDTVRLRKFPAVRTERA